MTDSPETTPEVAPVKESKVSVVFRKAKEVLQWAISLIGKYPGTALLVAVVSHAVRSVL
jgi:hypothetical protein